MGCTQSKVDNEEAVTRCKERKLLMKEAVTARNVFASGQCGYAVYLKNTGAAISDFAHGESDYSSLQNQNQPPLSSGASQPQPPPPPPPSMNLPPPPPLPNFSPSPIKRALSMPEISLKQERKTRFDLEPVPVAILEEEEEFEEESELDHSRSRKKEVKESDLKKSQDSRDLSEETHVPPMPDTKNNGWDYFFMVDDMPMPGPSLEAIERNANDVRNESVEFDDMEPKMPEKVVEEKVEEVEEVEEEEENEGLKQIEHSKTAPPEFMRMGVGMGAGRAGGVPSVNLMQVLSEIDDLFLKASECAQEVSKMLEATRLHYHSNFADNRGHIDHSARVMRVITWNRSLRGVRGGENGKDDPDSEDFETHATILDKLLAWEKKLYEEVKQGELMKYEYKRKVNLLNKQKKRDASADTLEKTKAAVSHLHTRYIVDMQSMDSTVSEVNHIRDEQLYPKLVSLVDGMVKMWASMCMHHESQLRIVTDLKTLDITYAVKETTKQHHERTIQLWKVILEWHSQFEKLVTHQKHYIQALNSWLKLNLIPIESSLKEKLSSPPRAQNPPIQVLLQSWNDELEKLPDELAKTAISSFAAVIETIIHHQEEEMKLKERCEETRKEYLRKNQAFEEWYQKFMERKHHTEQADSERGEETNPKDPVSEKQFVVETLKKRLEEEVEAHQKTCLQVREKSLGSLKIRLPELFRALSDYARACSEAYVKVRSVTQSQNTSRARQ